MRYILILSILFLNTGCTIFQKKKPTPPPSVSTEHVIQSLTETKNELKESGEMSEKIGANIDKALTLAERLQKVLDEIEKSQTVSNNKNTIEEVKK